jgi:hypothetical protein
VYVFNTLTVGDRAYGLKDVKQFVRPEACGLAKSFYGGRVAWVGKTDTDVLVLFEETARGLRPIDTAAASLARLPIETLRALCDRRSIPYRASDTEEGKATTHKELQKLLK